MSVHLESRHRPAQALRPGGERARKLIALSERAAEELAHAVGMQMALSAVLLPSHYVVMYCERAEMVRVVAPMRRKSIAFNVFSMEDLPSIQLTFSRQTLIRMQTSENGAGCARNASDGAATVRPSSMRL